MSAFFADTFYWIALTNPKDAAHLAKSWRSRLNSPLAPSLRRMRCSQSFWPIALLIRSYAKRLARPCFSFRTILTSASFRQSRASFLDRLTLYNARPDKGYSLTDCISMQTMRREGLTEALTNDRHFEQEGFRALFRGA